ncbi:MAG: ABC transporter permease [Balneolaceae bacterium]|nr:ABC transporter permease [Balneolaceae bacterium]
MFANYLKIAFRNFVKNRSFTALSIASLAIAITCVLLIGFYAWKEFRYDRFHQEADQIYRLTTHSVNQQAERTVGFVPLPLAAHLAERFPAVRDFARVWEYRRAMPLSNPESNETWYEENFAWAEASFFDIFDFPIVQGRAEDPLADYRSVVISESMARKYFGEDDPIGRTLHFRGETDIPLQVSAVMRDFPEYSHFHFDFVADIRTAAEDFWAGGTRSQEFFEDWINLFVPAYILTEPEADLEPVLAEASRQLNDRLEVPGSTYEVQAQPLTSIHLNSRLDVGEWAVNGSRANVYAVMGVGLIILLLGCFNFINLVTAQAGKRVKEVGLRKTMGSSRAQLMGQHFMETTLLVMGALLISLFAVEVIQPWLGSFGGMEGAIAWLMQPIPLALLAGLSLLLILLAGVWPALYLSRFSPSAVLKGNFGGRLGGGGLRKVLITTQFALSGALIVCTLVIYQQLQHMQQTELGFAEEQILIIPIHRDNAIIPNFDRLKETYLQNASVRSVTSNSHLMLATYTYTRTFRLQGRGDEFRWEYYTVEGDFPQTYGLQLAAGRFFRTGADADTNAVILNRSAVREMGMEAEEAVGQIFNEEGLVVGVVEDFHYQSMHEAIQPFVLINQPLNVDFISVRIDPGDLAATIDELEQAWNRVIPAASFGYYFLDDTFGAIYRQEHSLSRAVLGFSGVAIFLACLGLFGLSLFTAERRTKEIGVRKSLGATIWDIVLLLGSDFTKLILLSLAVALPASWFLMDSWLGDYAYRIELSWWMFAVGSLFVVLVSWLTISWNSIRAATVNPVEALRSE